MPKTEATLIMWPLFCLCMGGSYPVEHASLDIEVDHAILPHVSIAFCISASTSACLLIAEGARLTGASEARFQGRKEDAPKNDVSESN